MGVYYIQNCTGFQGDFVNVLRVDEDGLVWALGLGEQDDGYLAWVASGNTAQEWQPEDAD